MYIHHAENTVPVQEALQTTRKECRQVFGPSLSLTGLRLPQPFERCSYIHLPELIRVTSMKTSQCSYGLAMGRHWPLSPCWALPACPKGGILSSPQNSNLVCLGCFAVGAEEPKPRLNMRDKRPANRLHLAQGGWRNSQQTLFLSFHESASNGFRRWHRGLEFFLFVHYVCAFWFMLWPETRHTQKWRNVTSGFYIWVRLWLILKGLFDIRPCYGLSYFVFE